MQKIKTFLFFSLILLVFLFFGCFVFADSVTVPSIIISENMDSIIEENVNQIDLGELPWIVKFLVGKPEFNIIIKMNSNEKKVYGLKVNEERKVDLNLEGYEKPDYIVHIDEDSLIEIGLAEDSEEKVNELYNSGKIVIEPQKFKGKFLFKIASWFF